MSGTFKIIERYYSQFDEWSRLDKPAGIIEEHEVLHLIKNLCPPASYVLDLGSGPGRYALSMAKIGFRLDLLDLSNRLIEQAKLKFQQEKLTKQVGTFWTANATDLSFISSDMYDVVFSCGPFYHLINQADRLKAAKEILRVCKPGGVIIIGFIPRFTGLAGLLFRAANNPSQVDDTVFNELAQKGIFRNKTNDGFQEGFCPTVKDFKKFWEKLEIKDMQMYSTRSFIHQNENHLLYIRDHNPELFNSIIQIHRKNATNEAFIEAGGHALLVAKKASQSIE